MKIAIDARVVKALLDAAWHYKTCPDRSDALAHCEHCFRGRLALGTVAQVLKNGGDLPQPKVGDKSVYFVTWGIEVHADAPRGAAQMAQWCQQTSREGYDSGVFEVRRLRATGPPTNLVFYDPAVQIDLNEDEQDGQARTSSEDNHGDRGREGAAASETDPS